MGPALCIAIACAGTARAAPWSLQRIDTNLYQVAEPPIFVRTEGCDERPVSGTAILQKHGDSSFLAFTEPAVRCQVRDVLKPVTLYEDEGTVRLTQDQNANWYQVTDGDFYLHTAGCFIRGFSEIAFLKMIRDGSGRIRFPDGRGCTVIRAFRRVTP
jgi:hypothetical protein